MRSAATTQLDHAGGVYPAPPARLVGWDWSALTYSLTYGSLSHQLDTDLLSYMGDRITGAVVADCGCGPGVVARKLVARGAARVYAIDASEPMLRRIPEDPRITPVQATMESLPLDLLRCGPAAEGFDLVLFKRSLYMERAAAVTVLANALHHLRPGGLLAIVHPERSLLQYLMGGDPMLGWYTVYHLFNRTISLVSRFVGTHRYALYTRAELRRLAADAAGAGSVELIPSRQRAFNLVALKLPAG